MRLAIVTPYPPKITGIGQYGFHVSRLLAASGVFSQITILTPHQTYTAGESLPPVIHAQQGWEHDRWNAGFSIAARLRSLQPDLAWFNIGASVFGRVPMANLSGYYSVFLTRRMGIPAVVTLHEVPELSDLRSLKAPGGALARSGARLLTTLATRADVTCVTLKRYLDWLRSRFSNNHFMHIPLGSYHSPELLPESNQPELLFFTTLAPFKGLEVLLSAFSELKRSYPALRLTIAGAEHIRFPGYLEKVKNTSRHPQGIRWLGQVGEAQVRSIFESCQIVVLPYQASTGSSSVVWQAAAWGRAMVASDLAETVASIKENQLSVNLFRSGDVQGLIKAIKQLLDSRELRARQAMGNIQVIQRHHPQDTCRAYLQAFNHALEIRGRTSRLQLPAGVSLEAS